MKYYKFVVKMGHVGCGNYLETEVFVKALNMLSAMSKAKRIPGVKHNRLPLKGIEISENEYIEGIKANPYIQSMSKIFGDKNEKNSNLH